MDKEFSLILMWKKVQLSGRIACSVAQINYSVTDPEIKLSTFTAVNQKKYINIFQQGEGKGKGRTPVDSS